jgi:hypothetical protein
LEQIEKNEDNQKAWLEPFKKWILTAKTLGEVATTGAPQEKKLLAREVFGSNLFLDSKKARGSALKPWFFLSENSSFLEVVPRLGLEPIFCVFSSLLIVAFVCDYLHRLILHFSFVYKLFVASNGNKWQKMLCGVVRWFPHCAGLCGTEICAESVRQVPVLKTIPIKPHFMQKSRQLAFRRGASLLFMHYRNSQWVPSV